MIPQFPNFKNLELSDKKDVESFTSKFPPYSDFNFVSMWSWDIKGDMRLSILNDNLVVRFTDYLTGELFYSFLGSNKVNETVEELLNLSKKEELQSKLRLVPEDSIKDIDTLLFKIEEDRDHFDYVYEIKKLSLYTGSHYQKHRKMVRRFERDNKFKILILNLTEDKNKKLLFDLVESWINKHKDKNGKIEDHFGRKDLENEFIAFEKLLKSPHDFLNSLICFSLFVNEKLCGFIINEKISKQYCITHFGKADVEFEGIYQFLMHHNAKVFFDLGVEYFNHEQDLGLPNLKLSKDSYGPVYFLKKYNVALQDKIKV